MKQLAGTHRVQRVPTTEKSGRRHSSTINVVWLEGRAHTSAALLREDVREEFIRTSGKGGQNRNKVSSCVRLTHLPTGTQVVADGERKQAQNRKIAWERLEATLASRQSKSEHNTQNCERAAQIGAERTWTWTGWRDEVKSGKARTSMRQALKGRLAPLLK